MPTDATLLAFVATVAVICVVPGPDQLFIIAASMRHGRRGGLAASAGMTAGMAVHTVAAVVGLSALLRSSAMAFEVVRLAGVAYLLWLAVGAFRRGATRQPVHERRERGGSMRRVARQAAVTNLLNPKVIVFFLAFLPQFVEPSRGQVELQLLVLGGVFTTVGLVIDAGVAVLAGALTARVRRSRMVDRIAGLVYVGLAARLAADR